MKNKLIILLVLMWYPCYMYAQSIIVGKVSATVTNEPLPNVTVHLSGGGITVKTDVNGVFRTKLQSASELLTVSHMGYKTQEFLVQGSPDTLFVTLDEVQNWLTEVEVSTGYQTLEGSRQTGSFVKIDNDLLNRRVSTDVISRLEDVVPGLILNRGSTDPDNQTPISIRGQSTLFSRPDPLIVLDNFPYDGDINNINPNDVESVTVLKDAAAAAIWGARAGNGVIVITTKKGRTSEGPAFSFNTNFTVGEKPDLFYDRRISTADFIDMEKMLFSLGFYARTEASTNNEALSPVVEALIAERDGLLTAQEAEMKIRPLESIDRRREALNHMYRYAQIQQYALNMSGGNDGRQYFLSVGYDENNESVKSNGTHRLSLHTNTTYQLLNNRLEITGGAYYVDRSLRSSDAVTNYLAGYSANSVTYPYAPLLDSDGNASPVIERYRKSFLTTAHKAGLLDWEYKPMEELMLRRNHTREIDYRINAGAVYRILDELKVEMRYQYGGNIQQSRNMQHEGSYAARNMVNMFTSVRDGLLVRPVPVGGILDRTERFSDSHNLRGQINYNGVFGEKHHIDAFGGIDIKTLHAVSNANRGYGYDEEHATSALVDYFTRFPYYYSESGASGLIPGNEQELDIRDNFRSFFAAASYNFNRLYSASITGRIDQSNLFGVNSNQKGAPLWSVGFGWELSNEQFYRVKFLPYLRTRLTYGYNGNVNKHVSAYTTAYYRNGNNTDAGLPYANVVNPPNPDLRWERTRIINVGLDFSMAGNVVGGSIEFYKKQGLDLIGTQPYPSSSGITSFTGNYANTAGYGWELNLESRNINRAFKWYTNWLFTYSQDKVTAYHVKDQATRYLQSGASGTLPLEGKPLYAIYSYKWAGLNPQTGAPVGVIGGVESENYRDIINGATPENIRYHGSARPLGFGAIRNTFSWQRVSISASISYRFGYYFRRNSIRYQQLFTAKGGHADYAIRWQKPGDEALTNVPAMPVYGSSDINYRDNFYLNSSALVEKGDHIRLQDINLSYDLLGKSHSLSGLKSMRLYLYANDLGLLWRANDANLDPDYLYLPPTRTIAIGATLNF